MTCFRAFALIFLLGALAITSAAHAAAPATGPYGEQNLTLTKTGRPAVVALIGNQGPFLFILDTASSQTIVSEKVLTRLGAEARGGKQIKVTTVSGSISAEQYRVRDVSTAGITLDHLDVVKAPIPEELGADGVFGSDYLGNFIVEMDWTTRKFRLYPFGNLPPVKDFHQIRGRLDKRAFLVLPGRCRNIACDVVLDTGALASLGNRPLGQQLPPTSDLQVAINFLEVNGLQSSGVQAVGKILTRLRIGSLTWTKREIAVADLAVFDQLEDPSRATLFLGLDILGKGHLVIDYDRAVMYFRRS